MKISKEQLIAKAKNRYGDSVTVEYHRGKEGGWYLIKANRDSFIGKNINEAYDWFNDIRHVHYAAIPKNGKAYDYMAGGVQDELLYINADGYIALTLLEHSDISTKRSARPTDDRFSFEVGMRILVPLCKQDFLPLGTEAIIQELRPNSILTDIGEFTYNQPLVYSDETDNYHPLFDLAFTHVLNAVVKKQQLSVAKIQQNNVIPFSFFKDKKWQKIVPQSGVVTPIGEPIGEPLGNHTYNKEIIEHDWVTSERFSKLAGISERMAKKVFHNIFNGKKWRNHDLNIRLINSERGGKSGARYELYAPTLPVDLRAKWYAQFVDATSAMACYIPVKQSIVQQSIKRFWSHSVQVAPK